MNMCRYASVAVFAVGVTLMASTPLDAQGTLPGAPRNFVAGVAGFTISLAWEAPLVGVPVDDYVLQFGTASGIYDVYNGSIGPLTSLSFPIPPGTYHFRVIAVNTVGPGPPTSEVSVTVGDPLPTTLPSAPQTVTATAVGSTLTVSWAAPATGGPITGYILQVGSASGVYNFYNGPYGTVTSLSAAAPDGVYYFRVIAQNVVGQGPPSNEVSVTVGIPAPTVLPSAPQTVTATAVGSMLTVSWAAPATGGPITGYILQAGAASGVYNFYNGPYGTVTSLSAAAPDGVYYFRVIAQNVVGQGPPSSEVSVTVGIPPPAPAMAGAAAPTTPARSLVGRGRGDRMSSP